VVRPATGDTLPRCQVGPSQLAPPSHLAPPGHLVPPVTSSRPAPVRPATRSCRGTSARFGVTCVGN